MGWPAKARKGYLLIVGIWRLTVMMELDVTIQLLVVILLGVIMVWGTYAFIRYNEVHQTQLMQRLSRFSARNHFGKKKWWKAVTRFLDAPEGELTEEMDKKRMTRLGNKFTHTKDK